MIQFVVIDYNYKLQVDYYKKLKICNNYEFHYKKINSFSSLYKANE